MKEIRVKILTSDSAIEIGGGERVFIIDHTGRKFLTPPPYYYRSEEYSAEITDHKNLVIKIK